MNDHQWSDLDRIPRFLFFFFAYTRHLKFTARLRVFFLTFPLFSMQLSEPCLQTLAADTSDACIDVLEEDFLPSYEAAVGGLDIAKLPSYRRTLSARFHPYKRPALKNVDERDRLFVSNDSITCRHLLFEAL